jgi:hypothetical protein
VPELHQDGSREDKTFAPGYGEFFTGSGGDVEAMALAVPTDALEGAPPAEPEALSAGADKAFEAVRAKNWKAASASGQALSASWESYRAGEVSPRLAAEMSRALETLSRSVEARGHRRAATAAIDVAQSALEFKLRYQPPLRSTAPVLSSARVSSRSTRQPAMPRVSGAISPRTSGSGIDLRVTLDTIDLTRLDHQFVVLRRAVTNENLRGAAAGARRLRNTVAMVEARG